MTCYLFFLLAAFFNAVMDAVENENFHESIFRNLPKQFWYKRESWKYVPRLLGYKFDAWHIAKSLMIACWTLALVFVDYNVPWWVEIPTVGVVWNVSFHLFYHVIFKVK
jgi:hypothetical protein